MAQQTHWEMERADVQNGLMVCEKLQYLLNKLGIKQEIISLDWSNYMHHQYTSYRERVKREQKK